MWRCEAVAADSDIEGDIGWQILMGEAFEGPEESSGIAAEGDDDGDVSHCTMYTVKRVILLNFALLD
jgi:hypothetical protein